jgi:hypothetical protein
VYIPIHLLALIIVTSELRCSKTSTTRNGRLAVIRQLEYLINSFSWLTFLSATNCFYCNFCSDCTSQQVIKKSGIVMYAWTTEKTLNLGCLQHVACVRSRWRGGLFHLRNVTVMGFFYYLLLLKLLHVSVVWPSSSRNMFARIYSTDNGSVVFRI